MLYILWNVLFYVVFIYLNNKFRFPGDSCGYEGSDIANPSKRGKKIGLCKKKIPQWSLPSKHAWIIKEIILSFIFKSIF